MRILLINPPYHAVTSLYGVGEQVPLGLLSVGGPLLDAGHEVTLLDAEAARLRPVDVVDAVQRHRPDVVMTGHGGSTPAHPVTMAMARAIRSAVPGTPLVYGGVYPTYHASDVLEAEPAVDVIVCGEGERTTVLLAEALAGGRPLGGVNGLAFREGGTVRRTPPADVIVDLDAYRVGWELIDDWDRYHCWGIGRSTIVQLSRGCPHRCSYCGQHDFWRKWRHRDPIRLADEIVWLHRRHGVRFVDLADENPTASKRVWRRFLEEIIARSLPLTLFATIRASDIVRDADILPLYRQAGMACVLMGIETTDPATIARIRKGSTTREDQLAVRLLREHGILSMVGHIVGFEEERSSSHWNALKQLLAYDPDLLNAMYVTPHRWTAVHTENDRTRGVIQADQAKWDYRHQVLTTRHLRPWQVFAWVKLLELILHLRPRALRRLLWHPDRELRRSLRWCFRRSARVWLDEVHDFLFRTRFLRSSISLAEFWSRSRPRPGASARRRRQPASDPLARTAR